MWEYMGMCDRVKVTESWLLFYHHRPLHNFDLMEQIPVSVRMESTLKYWAAECKMSFPIPVQKDKSS